MRSIIHKEDVSEEGKISYQLNIMEFPYANSALVEIILHIVGNYLISTELFEAEIVF